MLGCEARHELHWLNCSVFCCFWVILVLYQCWLRDLLEPINVVEAKNPCMQWVAQIGCSSPGGGRVELTQWRQLQSSSSNCHSGDLMKTRLIVWSPYLIAPAYVRAVYSPRLKPHVTSASFTAAYTKYVTSAFMVHSGSGVLILSDMPEAHFPKAKRQHLLQL